MEGDANKAKINLDFSPLQILNVCLTFQSSSFIGEVGAVVSPFHGIHL